MKSKLRIHILGILAISTLFSFCSRPKEVHSKKEMERIMYDIYIAESIIEDGYTEFNTPEKKEAVINEVFKRNKTTQARWDTSLTWYSDRVSEYLKINDTVRARLQRKQKSIETLLNNQLAIEMSVKDRATLSDKLPFTYSFTEVNPKNGFRFKLDSAHISTRIDSTNTYFTFDAIGVPSDKSPTLYSQLILEYKDTTIIKNELVNKNGSYSMPVDKYIVDDTLRSLFGFIRLQDTTRSLRNIHINNIYIGNIDSLASYRSSEAADNFINSEDIDKPVLRTRELQTRD